MNFEKRTAVSLSEIKKMIEQGDTQEATKSIDRLWEVMGRLGRNKEVIHCGATIHTEETISEAERENNVILGSSSSLMLHQILLAK